MFAKFGVLVSKHASFATRFPALLCVQITTVRKKANPPSGSPTLSSKDDNRVPKSKTPGGGGGSGLETATPGGRRTRSNSVDQAKQPPKTPGNSYFPTVSFFT